MTDIKFYVCQRDGLDERLKLSYKLVNMALKHNFKIHIHTDNEQTSQKVDHLLWSQEAQSFITHTVLNEDTNPQGSVSMEQVVISHDVEPIHNCDYLINLSNQRPSFFSRFLKVAEILDNNENIISAGRERYAFYRDRGYTLEFHKL
jgi:DNA polymerase-3 subunit chi